MPWIPFYADEKDFQDILERLNKDEEIAIIISNGEKRWIAKRQIDILADGHYYLWHIPSGPLPLLFRQAGELQIARVENPFNGWQERLTGADPSIPFLGNHPGVIRLTKAVRGAKSTNVIGMSSFSWIGNRYKSIGFGATETTERWWRRLRKWVRKIAVKQIPRAQGLKPEIWVFPSAYRKILEGTAYDINPPV